jgi:hypothetical protein
MEYLFVMAVLVAGLFLFCLSGPKIRPGGT